ncbi:L-threonylcarbamoyladenylate synthase [Pseudoduganella namucuonensis]|uniref:Threonylcarbamoyl-AMP synthase n=1 Tax=Pseudoduganella namucuonensis TaxID=1035707 RepID=A0A1I7KKM8_9BURK|nr:L-threonylcarbamoyladenylate synthase [Pseudoduganella namucuonensis]SFU97982.1 translation factor SUA5 [Pseudoduganella namucuonensis]
MSEPSQIAVDQAAVGAAAAVLRAGGLVAFPTETVYGLGADAENPDAVAAIYAAKGRPQDHPVIVHVAPGADLDYWVTDIPEAARQLVAAFWPGPLTLILKRASHIPDAVSGGQDTVGMRCPSHPVAIALLSAFKGGKGGVAAPSANKFGNVSPTTAQHVRDEFCDMVMDRSELAEAAAHAAVAAAMARLGGGDAAGFPGAAGGATRPSGPGAAGLRLAVLDGGSSQVGIESTILDLSRLATHGPVLLRPGHIGAQDIADVIGVMPNLPDQGAPRASGTLESHYAPKAPVALVDGARLPDVMRRLAAKGRKAAVIHYTQQNTQPGLHQAMPADAPGYAFGLYAALRAMDQTGAELILVETPPQETNWLGVNDRLRRAAHGSSGIVEMFLRS